MLYDIDGSFCCKGEDKAYQMACALVTLLERVIGLCGLCDVVKIIFNI